MSDRIQVPLELDHFEVVDSVVVDGRLEVMVVSTFPRGCFHCGSVDVVGHGRFQRRSVTVLVVIRRSWSGPSVATSVGTVAALRENDTPKLWERNGSLPGSGPR